VRVDEIMSAPVVTVGPDMSLKDVAALLVARDISAAPVLDSQQRLVGLVSEADVMQLELHDDPRRHVAPRVERTGAAPQVVDGVMTRDVVAVPPDTDVAEVAQLMLSRRIRSIPVVESGQVVGIVSRRDVLRVLVRSDSEIEADLRQLLQELPTSMGHWDVRVRQGVVTWTGSGPEDVRPFLTKLAFTVRGAVDVRVEHESVG
jgi:CBS domain-containing protein